MQQNRSNKKSLRKTKMLEGPGKSSAVGLEQNVVVREPDVSEGPTEH
jgi:hypothetical protein